MLKGVSSGKIYTLKHGRSLHFFAQVPPKIWIFPIWVTEPIHIDQHLNQRTLSLTMQEIAYPNLYSTRKYPMLPPGTMLGLQAGGQDMTPMW